MIIKNIWAVGRNYADHAKELGNTVPAQPMIFLKAGTCATLDSSIQIPKWTEDVHHELEIALQWDDKLHFSQMTLALDLTERKKQAELKSLGHPWTLAKSFTNSCPIATQWTPYIAHETYTLSLFKNQKLVQNGKSSDMIHTILNLKKFVESHFPVASGDLLLTGTPAGVGPLAAGDQLRAELRNSHHEVLIEQSWVVA